MELRYFVSAASRESGNYRDGVRALRKGVTGFVGSHFRIDDLRDPAFWLELYLTAEDLEALATAVRKQEVSPNIKGECTWGS